jgi:hypothetical protein
MSREAKLWIAVLLLGIAVLTMGYLALRAPRLVQREDAIIQTNRILVERLVVITNEIKELRHADEKEAAGIAAARGILRANNTASAIQRFYALSSNQ